MTLIVSFTLDKRQGEECVLDRTKFCRVWVKIESVCNWYRRGGSVI